jgi:hypothetical protein
VFTALTLPIVIAVLVWFVLTQFRPEMTTLSLSEIFDRRVGSGSGHSKNFWITYFICAGGVLPFFLTRLFLDLRERSSRMLFRVWSMAFFIPAFFALSLTLISLCYYVCASGMGNGRGGIISETVGLWEMICAFPKGFTTLRRIGLVVIFLGYGALFGTFCWLTKETPPLWNIVNREGVLPAQRRSDRAFMMSAFFLLVMPLWFCWVAFGFWRISGALEIFIWLFTPPVVVNFPTAFLLEGKFRWVTWDFFMALAIIMVGEISITGLWIWLLPSSYLFAMVGVALLAWWLGSVAGTRFARSKDAKRPTAGTTGNP